MGGLGGDIEFFPRVSDASLGFRSCVHNSGRLAFLCNLEQRRGRKRRGLWGGFHSGRDSVSSYQEVGVRFLGELLGFFENHVGMDVEESRRGLCLPAGVILTVHAT